MEHHWDILDSLDPDVSSKILMSLDDPADIVRASSVSRAWRDFVIANGICKHLCLRLFPQLSGIITRVVDTSNKQEKCGDAGSSRAAEMEHLKKEHRAFVSLARGLTTSEVGECLSDAISASSTDNYPEEGVHNTLESRDRIGRRASYWSSSGQSNPEVPERLTYKLISDFCIITEVNVQPFQGSLLLFFTCDPFYTPSCIFANSIVVIGSAFFQENSPIYSAKAVRIRMGHKVLPDDEESVTLHGGQECAEEKFVWTYTSEEFPMVQENRLQNFKLREPVLCVGGFLRIELLVIGRSLAPVFGVETVDQNGRFALLYNPHAQFSSPRGLHEEGDEITVTPEMVRRHVRGWEQILNMLRGTLGVEVYDSEDENHDSDDEVAEEYVL
ncbi:hypothetical protein RDABS01_008206 [Bienertia sinuspersici]